jgi:uncharacterized membrane protein YeaQ/YmgE (transglycosylase-associated protein family)
MSPGAEMSFACYVVALMIGAVFGALATFMTKTRRLALALSNVAVGMAGAAAMAWFVSPMSSDAPSGRAGMAQILGAAFGALVSLALWQVIRPDG